MVRRQGGLSLRQAVDCLEAVSGRLAGSVVRHGGSREEASQTS